VMGELDRGGPDPAGPAVHQEGLAGLRVVEVPVTAGESFDLDTPADLVTARLRLAGPGHR
ncbi:MAG TPA: hypothetical protein VFP72_09980, partial [Kineosporiaceae bacterium]|nr:hypothetical protein [Kineosporiaceae bacterium]